MYLYHGYCYRHFVIFFDIIALGFNTEKSKEYVIVVVEIFMISVFNFILSHINDNVSIKMQNQIKV